MDVPVDSSRFTWSTSVDSPLTMVRRIGASRPDPLLHGATGTGRETLARQIYACGADAGARFPVLERRAAERDAIAEPSCGCKPTAARLHGPRRTTTTEQPRRLGSSARAACFAGDVADQDATPARQGRES